MQYFFTMHLGMPLFFCISIPHTFVSRQLQLRYLPSFLNILNNCIKVMKSVSFLRNTWKKWESKTSDNRDTQQISSPQEPQKAPYSQSTTVTGRSLNARVKHLPVDTSTIFQIEGSWQPYEQHQPSSPMYSQFTQNRSDRTLVHRESGRFDLNATYRARGGPSHDSFKSPSSSSLSLQAPPKTPPKIPSSSAPWLATREKGEARAADLYSPTHDRHSPRSPPSSPRSPSLPSFKLLPPIDLNYGPGSKIDNLLEGISCKCVPPTHSRDSSRCPRNTVSEAQDSMTPPRITDTLQLSSKTVHAVLDPSNNGKPRRFYRNAGSSTPHLPYKDRVGPSIKSDLSTCSVDSSETGPFPLSLFPVPPPLIVRKKIPAPLILQPRLPSSAQSSRDSTPVGTPTTPRFQHPSSPPQSSTASPTKKFYLSRSSTSFSPPPFSPPNSPLPKPPIALDGCPKSSDRAVGTLRNTQSNANLRDSLPFSARHRLTSSEPISDQTSLPIKRPTKPRRAERPKNIQAYMNMEELTSEGVQWGYAL
ncbi:hypothetical protein GALMADRAFT_682077 [Galerina marginata CBS 339.88]|uniref:Uncharacterized protein n=1 Tax=Galerina marginata (strain CBS 339.88) TaxID=685588 RepID=A0A067TL35_GALM3|nr:hypothetical protein GALMADRAFT_682077 [Galerina marginata CBS 339.88]